MQVVTVIAASSVGLREVHDEAIGAERAAHCEATRCHVQNLEQFLRRRKRHLASRANWTRRYSVLPRRRWRQSLHTGGGGNGGGSCQAGDGGGGEGGGCLCDIGTHPTWNSKRSATTDRTNLRSPLEDADLRAQGSGHVGIAFITNACGINAPSSRRRDFDPRRRH